MNPVSILLADARVRRVFAEHCRPHLGICKWCDEPGLAAQPTIQIVMTLGASDICLRCAKVAVEFIEAAHRTLTDAGFDEHPAGGAIIPLYHAPPPKAPKK